METQFPNLVEDSLRRVNRVSLTKSGLKSTSASKDVESFIYSYWLGLTLLLHGRPCPLPVVGQFKQLLNNLLDCSGYLEFIESCSEVRTMLCMSGSTTTLSKGKTRWARSLVKCINALYQQPVRHPSGDFNRLMSYLNWLKRAPIFIRSTKVAVDEYLENEERLRLLDLSHHYVPLLRSVWCEFYGDFRLRAPFRPRHGSGSTADAGRVASHKWDRMSGDLRARVLLKAPNLETLFSGGSGPWCKPRAPQPERIAKVVFVPKQAGKDRTICMEPAWLQFLQQGVFDQLRSYLQRCPASGHFDIRNQDTNRDLCHRAYVEGFSTIDLSNASDSVSWNLIKILAKGTPLLGYLYATRSDHALLNGVKIPLNKYAPMGSALCFPIECMLFACVLEVAYRIHYGEPSRGHHSGVATYGDDIICPMEIYHLVVDILTSIGFKVNESKSYETGPYFESCGVEYLYGARIETIRHPRAHIAPLGGTVSPESVGMVTDLANSLLDFDAFLTRRVLLKSYEDVKVRVEMHLVRFHDLVDWSDTGLRPVSPQYCTVRFDRDVQRSFQPVRRIVASPSRSRNDWTHYVCSQQFDPPEGPIVDRKWSTKGMLALLRMGHHDLLQRGEMEPISPCRAGRVRYKLSRNKRYL